VLPRERAAVCGKLLKLRDTDGYLKRLQVGDSNSSWINGARIRSLKTAHRACRAVRKCLEWQGIGSLKRHGGVMSFGSSGAMLIEIPYLFRAYNFKNKHFPIVWSPVPYCARLLLPHEWGAK
jgi:hypothetical protein